MFSLCDWNFIHQNIQHHPSFFFGECLYKKKRADMRCASVDRSTRYNFQINFFSLSISLSSSSKCRLLHRFSDCHRITRRLDEMMRKKTLLTFLYSLSSSSFSRQWTQFLQFFFDDQKFHSTTDLEMMMSLLI